MPTEEQNKANQVKREQQTNAQTSQPAPQSADDNSQKNAVKQKHDQTQEKSEKEGKVSKTEKKPKKKKTRDLRKSLLVKASVLGIIDLLAFFLLIYYVGQVPFISDEISDAAKQNVTANENAAQELSAQITRNKTQIDLIDSYFNDEVGYVKFVQEIDGLRNSGVVTNFEPRSQNYIKDKTKSLGLPFVIEFTGSEDVLSQGINKLQNLPFMIRPINVSVVKIDDVNYILTYGGFLYVDETLGQN